MTWYAAHTIVSIRPIKRRDSEIIVYENVILINAKDDEQAVAKARKQAKASIAKDDSLTIAGEPAVQSFVGVRKMIAVSNPWPLSQDDDRPVDGTEITYSKFIVKNERALSDLANGKETLVRYQE
jgi:Domain of unknown function (DUF4288)